MPPKAMPPIDELSEANRWVVNAMEHAGMSQAELAKALADRKVINKDRSIVNKIVQGVRDVKLSEALAIAEITGFAPPMPFADPRLRKFVQMYLSLKDRDQQERLAAALQQEAQSQDRADGPTDPAKDDEQAQ